MQSNPCEACAPRGQGPSAAASREPEPGAAGGAPGHLAELPEPHRVQPPAAARAACSSSWRRLFGVDLHAFGARRGRARSCSDLARGLRRPALRRLRAHVDRPARPRARPPAGRPRGARALPLLQDRSATRASELASRLDGRGARPASTGRGLPSEEVNDLVQQHMNHFPELEEGAEELWRKGRARRRGALPGPRRATSTSTTASRCGIARGEAERGVAAALRRRRRRSSRSSELLPTRVAHLPARPPDRAAHAARAHRPHRRPRRT